MKKAIPTVTVMSFKFHLLYTVGQNTYKFRMNNMCNTFFLFEHIILLLENCTGNKDTSFKSWIQPYEKHMNLIEMTRAHGSMLCSITILLDNYSCAGISYTTSGAWKLQLLAVD